MKRNVELQNHVRNKIALLRAFRTNLEKLLLDKRKKSKEKLRKEVFHHFARESLGNDLLTHLQNLNPTATLAELKLLKNCYKTMQENLMHLRFQMKTGQLWDEKKAANEDCEQNKFIKYYKEQLIHNDVMV